MLLPICRKLGLLQVFASVWDQNIVPNAQSTTPIPTHHFHAKTIILIIIGMKGTQAITGLILAASPHTNAELQIIGSGYGRTGTDTLRESLTVLGYKTYHMKEILFGQLHQDAVDWKKIIDTNCDDVELLKDIFERGGWTAAVDLPTSLCWEQLMQIYPNAQVIHTERTSAEKWYESASNSILIGSTMFPFNIMSKVVPFWIDHRLMVESMWSMIVNKSVRRSDAGWPDVYKKELMAAYDANNVRVREIVPNERLLIQDHSKGWELLTIILEKDVPDIPYPHSNTRKEFVWLFRKYTIVGVVAVSFLIVAIAFLLKSMLRIFSGGKKKKPE